VVAVTKISPGVEKHCIRNEYNAYVL